MEKLKLPRSSYEELQKIIIAYGTYGKPAGLDDIAQATGMGRTNISANNAFLSYVAIIEGGNKKSITSKGASLAKALEHDMKPETENAWSEIINDNDFLTKMLQAVRIRKGMDASQLENHVAFSSGEPKAPYVMTGAKAVVDILLASGLLRNEGDKLIALNSTNREENSQPSMKAETESNSEAQSVENVGKSIPVIRKQFSGVTLSIELTITASPDELDGLGKKIKSIIDDLKEDA
jgi:hypothetical protein